MRIERANILELIGTGKNKYHSCVITSYSIDLVFFEHLILPKLRSAGVTNINLFVDATMLEQYLSSHLGTSHKKFKANYSITPIKTSGAFHPKTLFLTGKEKGYLAVGSGNITSSGMLYNDEIWSSFYYTKDKNDTKSIFKSAWSFIENLKKYTHGINKLKISWIVQHAPWILDSQEDTSEESLIQDISYRFTYTNKDESLYNKTFVNFPKTPQSIKILAPYYNSDGAFIDKLIEEYKTNNIHCVVDSENGLLPYNFKNNIVQFSDWSDVVEKNNKNSIQRLHAKAIQLEYDEETIFILGSANATLEAFGISKRAVLNEEAIIILKSKKRTDFFKDLGINFPKIGLLKPVQFIKRTSDDNEKQSHSIKIKHSELEEDKLIINLKEIKSENFLLQTFDNNENILEQINILIDKSVLKCKLKKVEIVFKFAFYERNSLKRVSNFSLIQKTSILKKSNPDERLAKLQSFEFLDIFNTLNYELVLDFLDSEKVFQNQSKTMSILPLSDNDEDDDGEVITESEYNTNAMLGIDEFVTKDNITSMIEEFLDVLKIRDTQIDELSNNNEELAIEAGDDGLNSQINLDNQRRSINTKEGQRIQNKIVNTVKSVTSLIDNRFQKNIQQDERSIKALFIGFHILLHFWKEGYSEDISVIKIKYRNIEELSVLEKKFSLVRLESQISAIRNEVLYNIEYIKLNLFEDFVKNQKHVNITSNPTEPISNFNSFINDKFINSYLDNSLIASFLNKGLLTILWSIKTEELKINKEETVKLIILTNKLLLGIKGSKHFVSFKKLILLNMFDLFNLETFDLNNASEDMKEVLNSELFIAYKAFKEQLKLKQIISKKLESYLTNSIIYSTRYGFCRLKMVRKNFYIDIENPLGEYIKHGDYLGSFKVYVGENVKIFD